MRKVENRVIYPTHEGKAAHVNDAITMATQRKRTISTDDAPCFTTLQLTAFQVGRDTTDSATGFSEPMSWLDLPMPLMSVLSGFARHNAQRIG